MAAPRSRCQPNPFRVCAHSSCSSEPVLELTAGTVAAYDRRQQAIRQWRATNRSGVRMDEFPAIPTPTGPTPRIGIEQFLLLLHGEPGTGLPTGNDASSDLAAVSPRMVALDVRSPAEFLKGKLRQPMQIRTPPSHKPPCPTIAPTHASTGSSTPPAAGLCAVPWIE